MKKHLLAFCFLTIGIQASAFSFQDQLAARNSNWRSNRTLLLAGDAKSFENDKAFVQAHFAAVEIVLLNADVSRFTTQQLEARYRNIQVLHDYAARGIFPANHCSYSTPVFVDEFNTHCAVGHLMQQSGFDAMAIRIASRNNYIHAIDVNDPEVYAWQEASGLTMEELALIQPSYNAPPTAFEQPYACTTAYFNDYAWQGTKSIGQGSKDEQAKAVWYSGECENGVLNGKWEQYRSPGRIWIRGYFKDGKKNGEWTYYNERGSNEAFIEKSEVWFNGKLNGPFVQNDYSGRKSKEGTYVDGMKEGLWKTWSGASVFMEENYVHGKLHGDKIQYYVLADSAIKSIAQHDVYEHGVLLTRRFYNQQGTLMSQLDHIVDNHYHSVMYQPSGKISMMGEEILKMRLDSTWNDFYPNLPKTYYEQEVLIKAGRWTLFPNYGHQLVLANQVYGVAIPDSVHLYYSEETDSISAMVRFYKQGTKNGCDSTSYNCRQPNQLMAYYTPPNQAGREKWTYVDGVIQSYTGTWPNGSEHFGYYYKDGKLEYGSTRYITGEYFEGWTTIAGYAGPQLRYAKRDKKAIVLEEGAIVDTTMRYGLWEFHDSTGTLIAKGEYVNGLKEGKWTETNPDGTTWEGNYHEGKKKGTWVHNSQKGELIRKEKF